MEFKSRRMSSANANSIGIVAIPVMKKHFRADIAMNVKRYSKQTATMYPINLSVSNGNLEMKFVVNKLQWQGHQSGQFFHHSGTGN